jgi:hypothetical protein
MSDERFALEGGPYIRIIAAERAVRMIRAARSAFMLAKWNKKPLGTVYKQDGN